MGLQRIRIYDKETDEEMYIIDEFWLVEDNDKASFFVTLSRSAAGKVAILSYDKMCHGYKIGLVV